MRAFLAPVMASLLVTPATAQMTPFPATRLKPTTVAAFKNGLAFFICQGQAETS